MLKADPERFVLSYFLDRPRSNLLNSHLLLTSFGQFRPLHTYKLLQNSKNQLGDVGRDAKKHPKSQPVPGLAVSAVGFYQHYKWLSRMALALPFLLLPVQALRPDSAETLALRIYQALRPIARAGEDGVWVLKTISGCTIHI